MADLAGRMLLLRLHRHRLLINIWRDIKACCECESSYALPEGVNSRDVRKNSVKVV